MLQVITRGRPKNNNMKNVVILNQLFISLLSCILFCTVAMAKKNKSLIGSGIPLAYKFKKCILILGLLTSSMFVSGQKSEKWQLSFQLQPELTFHKNDYAFRWTEKFTKATFNHGISSSLYYNLTDKLFVEGGLGFISRRLKTKVFIAQSLLPPPYYDSVLILYKIKSVSFRTLQIPLSIGVNLARKKNVDVFVKGTYIYNFLFNTKYEANNYPAFRKEYWQGYSINVGLGTDYQLNKKVTLTNSISYSLVNTVKRDFYLYSQDERFIALTHTFLQLSAGIKIRI